MITTFRSILFWALFVLISSYPQDENYDDWVVEVVDNPEFDAETAARDIAKDLGIEFVRSVSDILSNFFHLRAEKGTTDISKVTRSLKQNTKLKRADYQLSNQVEEKEFYGQEEKTISYYPSPRCRCHITLPSQDTSVRKDVFLAMNNKKVNFSERYRFNDYRWPCQWQLYNCGQSFSPNEYDMDVVPVWNKGITGKGIVVAIVDDGVDFHHPEISPNYDAFASFDAVQYPDYDGPLPVYWKPHGTEVAGIVGMVANNRICGVGMVYNANIGAIRVIGTTSTDLREAAGLSFRNDYVDVYSNSWGPSDTGRLFRQPPHITSKALELGCEQGRKGKGNIYTFASGNGGLKNDHCSADGFSCSIYTIAVASSSRNGHSVDYGEQCPCIVVNVPSTDPHSPYGVVEDMIVPSLSKKCVNSFRGTSASTPMVSSVTAMMLQANPNITWRDVQYLMAHSALVNDPYNKQWIINGAGYHVNPYHGFGVLNALRIVEAAEKWKNVDVQHKCSLSFGKAYRAIPSGGKLTLKARANGCVGTKNQVLKLEHVQLILSYSADCRGDISIRLTSPCGTVSPIMNTRRKDYRKILINYPFMSVFHWGEDPRGIWTLEIIDNKGAVPSCAGPTTKKFAGHMWQYDFILWGVKEDSRKNTKAPVCDRKNVYDYLKKNNSRDIHFSTLIKKGAMSTAQIIHDEFIEDFSPRAENAASKNFQPRPPGPKKSPPYSIPYEKVTRAAWKATFPAFKLRVKTLFDYIMYGRSPDSKLMSSRSFEVVRHVIADRLEREATTTNDEGREEIRQDFLQVADLLRNKRRDAGELFGNNSDAKYIIKSIAHSVDM